MAVANAPNNNAPIVPSVNEGGRINAATSDIAGRAGCVQERNSRIQRKDRRKRYMGNRMGGNVANARSVSESNVALTLEARMGA